MGNKEIVDYYISITILIVGIILSVMGTFDGEEKEIAIGLTIMLVGFLKSL